MGFFLVTGFLVMDFLDGDYAAPFPVHQSWFDMLTGLAIFWGPVVVLWRLVDWWCDKYRVRFRTYKQVMRYRPVWFQADSLQVLNSIDVVFRRRKDKPIRDAWASVNEHVNTKRPDENLDAKGAQAWDNRLIDLRANLYQLMGVAVGYNYTLDYIKRRMNVVHAQ